jgi:hypothetical protein
MPARPQTVGEAGHLSGHQAIHDVLTDVLGNIPNQPSDIGAVDAAGAVTAVGGKLWWGTQAQYDALGTYDPKTLYVVP